MPDIAGGRRSPDLRVVLEWHAVHLSRIAAVVSPGMCAPHWSRLALGALPLDELALLPPRLRNAVLCSAVGRGTGQDTGGLCGAHLRAGREDRNLSFLLLSKKVSFQKGCDTCCVWISFPYMISHVKSQPPYFN